MTFEAVIGPKSLKSFTKSLACLSRYGDDVVIQAGPGGLVLCATNSSRTAFFRVKFTSEYFDKFKLNATQPGLTFQTPPEVEDEEKVKGQLLVKSLLSILKHKTVEQTVDRCDLSIVEGGQDSEPGADPGDEEQEDRLSSKLIVRLHCKHGVVKTHRLLLLTGVKFLAPPITSSTLDSRVVVGPRTLKDILDHFPHARGTKSDPELVWEFAINDVKVKSVEAGRNGKGKSQISTEIAISADEFDSYTISEPPITIAFHLREFNATVALAESLSVALDLRFTEPTEPIFIDFDTDASDSEYLFVISTTQNSSSSSGSANLRKRNREDDQESEEGPSTVAKKKSQRAAVKETSAFASQVTPRRPAPAKQNADRGLLGLSQPVSRAPEGREPLFMPGASQLSAADMDVLRESGLGIEHMDYEEFEAMMEAEGEEVGMSTGIHRDGGGEDLRGRNEEDTDMEYDMQMAPSQAPAERRGEKEFRPLFDD